jgi:small subunit ribosomal protein S8
MDYTSILLTKIRNAQVVGHRDVILPYSKMNESLINIFCERGLVNNIEVVKKEGKLKKGEKKISLKVGLKYKDKELKQSVIKVIKQISKPGRRVYLEVSEFPVVFNHKGFGVYSTSKGLLTDQQAKKANVGGEYLCEVFADTLKN